MIRRSWSSGAGISAAVGIATPLDDAKTKSTKYNYPIHWDKPSIFGLLVIVYRWDTIAHPAL